MKPKFRKIRKIPALPPQRLKAALDQLQRTTLAPAAKRQLEAMLRAAANPEAETPENVIRTLEPERRANVEATIQTLSGHRRSVTARGRDALMRLSDDEFDLMVQEANEDGKNL